MNKNLMALSGRNDARAGLAKFIIKEAGLRALAEFGVIWLALIGQKNNLGIAKNKCVAPRHNEFLASARLEQGPHRSTASRAWG
jgi:hypothetical protein